jgi:hypothetical protein
MAIGSTSLDERMSAAMRTFEGNMSEAFKGLAESMSQHIGHGSNPTSSNIGFVVGPEPAREANMPAV